MRKNISVLLIIVMIVGILSMNVLATESWGSLSVTADKTTANVGDTINYTVSLGDCSALSTGVWGFGFNLAIPEGLEYVAGSGKINAGFDSTTGMTSTTFTESTLNVTTFGTLTAGYKGSGAAILTFSCKATAAGSYTVSLTNAVLSDGANTKYPAIGGAAVTVKAPHVCTLTAVAGKDATCTETGLKAHYKCTDTACGKLYSDAAGQNEITDASTLVIPAKGHSFGDWTVTTAPTCTEKGVETRKCACGESETRDVAAKGHTISDPVVEKEATCTEDGKMSGKCSVCGTELSSETIPAKGHSFGDFCSDETSHWHECSVCGAVDGKEAHTYDIEVVLEKPSAERDGKAQMTCECGAKGEIKTLPATGSDLDDVPTTGDITFELVLSIAAILSILTAAAFVFKRSAVK